MPILYRTLVPRGVTNLICPGRALSVMRQVLGSLRVMTLCMAMGEVAGQAALQAVGEGRFYTPPAGGRRELAENNAVVEWK